MSKERSNRRAPETIQAFHKRVPNGDVRRNTDTKTSPSSGDQYYELVRAQVLIAWPQILQGLIEKAMNGGYQQAKLLLDLCDFSREAPVRPSQLSKQQLCDALLDGLTLSSSDRAMR
jgi:hypothetical protein